MSFGPCDKSHWLPSALCAFLQNAAKPDTNELGQGERLPCDFLPFRQSHPNAVPNPEAFGFGPVLLPTFATVTRTPALHGLAFTSLPLVVAGHQQQGLRACLHPPETLQK